MQLQVLNWEKLVKKDALPSGINPLKSHTSGYSRTRSWGREYYLDKDPEQAEIQWHLLAVERLVTGEAPPTKTTDRRLRVDMEHAQGPTVQLAPRPRRGVLWLGAIVIGLSVVFAGAGYWVGKSGLPFTSQPMTDDGEFASLTDEEKALIRGHRSLEATRQQVADSRAERIRERMKATESSYGKEATENGREGS